MSFYLFDQNNSGGYFIRDDNFCELVFIEAIDKQDAVSTLMEKLGAEDHGWCGCCGERWSTWGLEGLSQPLEYSSKLKEKVHIYEFPKDSCQSEAIIHYLDGTVERVVFSESGYENKIQNAELIKSIKEKE